jgi:hypothetical protein
MFVYSLVAVLGSAILALAVAFVVRTRTTTQSRFLRLVDVEFGGRDPQANVSEKATDWADVDQGARQTL